MRVWSNPRVRTRQGGLAQSAKSSLAERVVTDAHHPRLETRIPRRATAKCPPCRRAHGGSHCWGGTQWDQETPRQLTQTGRLVSKQAASACLGASCCPFSPPASRRPWHPTATERGRACCSRCLAATPGRVAQPCPPRCTSGVPLISSRLHAWLPLTTPMSSPQTTIGRRAMLPRVRQILRTPAVAAAACASGTAAGPRGSRTVRVTACCSRATALAAPRDTALPADRLPFQQPAAGSSPRKVVKWS